MKKKLVSPISYYHIKVEDMLRPDLTHDDFDVQDGTQLSEGIDLNLSYVPIRGLNIQAAFGYNHSKYTKAKDGLQGLRPYKAGPETTANLWASYKLTRGNLKGLGIAGGGFYGSSWDAVKSTYHFYVPDYMVLNTSIFMNSLNIGLESNLKISVMKIIGIIA